MAIKTANITPIPQYVLSKWHPTKNLPLLPENVSAGSTKRVIHWLCENGHEWTGNVSNEVKRPFPCKACSKFTLKTDGSDLETKFPDVADEWHPTKNGLLKPAMVSANTKEKVWWLGRCGHEWNSTPGNRTVHNQGCPFCSSNRLLVGFNDFATTNTPT